MPHYHSLSLLRRTFALWILNFETRRISGRVDISDSDQECAVHLRAVEKSLFKTGFGCNLSHIPGISATCWAGEQENGGMHCALEAILKNGIDGTVCLQATVDET